MTRNNGSAKPGKRAIRKSPVRDLKPKADREIKGGKGPVNTTRKDPYKNFNF